MKPAKFRKRLKRIERLAGVVIDAVKVAASGHLHLTVDGHRIVISSTPSCPYADRHVVGDLRRAMKQSKRKGDASPRPPMKPISEAASQVSNY